MDNLKRSVNKDLVDGVKFMGSFCSDEDAVMSEHGKVFRESVHDVNTASSTSDNDSSVETEMSDDDDDESLTSDDEAFLENDQAANKNPELKLKNVKNNDEPIKSYSKSKNKYNSQYSKVLNFQIVEKLEHDLDFYEKISIVFLVYEDSQLEYALQSLSVACKNTSKNHNIVSVWCLTKPKFWREKLLQALVIIKNFYVLSKLGYEKNVAMKLFHRENYITSIRKKMYYFCESLSIMESESLIKEVNNDLKKKKIYKKNIIDFDPKYLEISFLFWLSRKYICFYSNDVDLVNIINCLENSKIFYNIKKKLVKINNEYKPEKNKNKKTVKNPDFDAQNLKLTESNITDRNDNLSSVTSVSTVATASTMSSNWSQESQLDLDSDYYQIINPNKIGLIIIINQKNFKKREESEHLRKFLPKENLPDRDGTEEDVNRIKSTFTNLGYEVYVFNDLINFEILSTIENTVRLKFQRELHSSIILFILTHGYLGHVYGCNSIGVPIPVIERTLWQCESLTDKPKCIIIQACQGNSPLEVVVPDGPIVSRLHGACDLFLGLATVSGHAAFRDPRKGTWFIQTLCKCVKKFAHNTDFAKIFTRVNDIISKKRASDANGTQIYGQVSEFRSSLRAEWFLVTPRRGTALPIKDINA